jgi:hypothetical protein
MSSPWRVASDPDRAGDLPAGEVEGLPRPDVHETGKARLHQVGGGRLEDFERRDVRRRKVLKRDVAPLRGEDLRPFRWW